MKWWIIGGLEEKKGLIIKLDFQKAYDCLNWNYVLQMMRGFGFGDKWVEWIKECISTAKLSVLVNGAPTKEFSMQKGLRQGDPLSPFLFIIAAEGLNLLLRSAKEKGLILGVDLGSTDLVLSYLQFVDDTILFCNANREEVSESLQMIIFTSHRFLGDIANLLNCKSQEFPMTYLGLPLGANPRLKATWKPIIDKFKWKLAAWKRRFLSFGGRLTLIK